MYTTVKDKSKLKSRIKRQSKDRTSIDKKYVHYSMDTTEKLREDLKLLLDNEVITKAVFKDAQYLYRCMLEWKIEIDGVWEYGVTEHSERKMIEETGIGKNTLNASLEVLLKLGYIDKFEASKIKTPHVYVVNLLVPENEIQLARMIQNRSKEQQSEHTKSSVEPSVESNVESNVETSTEAVNVLKYEEEIQLESNEEEYDPFLDDSCYGNISDNPFEDFGGWESC